MAEVHYRNQAGAAVTTTAHETTHLVGGSDALPVGDATTPGLLKLGASGGALAFAGTAADSTKVANTTPGAGGLSILGAASTTAILATLAAAGVPGLVTTGKVGLPTIFVQQADASESAGTLTSSADLVAPIAAGASYAFVVILMGTAAAATTGLQWAMVGPGNDVVDAVCLHTPTGSTSESQVNGALLAATLAASTGSPVGPAPFIDFGFGALTAHASAPSPATLTVQFKTEVGASAVTLKKGSMMLVWRTL